MIYIDGGHTLLGKNYDPGASSPFGVEVQEAAKMRDLICKELDAKGCKYVKDKDDESLAQYLNRIQPGNASVVISIHFNSFNKIATGTEVIVEDEADRLDLALAKELAATGASIMGITNRGVKKESQTARKRLGLMREEGLISLIEICFIDNEKDMKAYRANMEILAKKYAEIIIRYEDLIK